MSQHTGEMEVDGKQLENGFENGGSQVGKMPEQLFNFGDMADAEELDKIDARPKNKAKRKLPKLSKNGHSPTAALEPLTPPSPTKLLKNMSKDRHSRTGVRGLPKKGGGGGKYTWGKLTDTYVEETGHTRDTKDPNYDSEEELDTVQVTASNVELSGEEFAKISKDTIEEYYDSANSDEVLRALNEYNVKDGRSEFIRVLLTLAMEKKPAYKEMSSRLIAVLHGKYFNSRDMIKGFDAVSKELDDLTLDSPDASDVFCKFLARAIADDCIPPSYLTKNGANNDKAKAAYKRAEVLVTMKHGIARLDSIWGVGGGQWPVKALTKQMNMILEEYIASSDLQEACRCISDLDVPHFHHEIVYEAILLSIEKSSELCLELMFKLTGHLYEAGVITKDQMNHGVLRIYEDIAEICLDVPNAYTTLAKFIEKGHKSGFVSNQLMQELPQRGRKRFVSQGDGGLIKEPED